MTYVLTTSSNQYYSIYVSHEDIARTVLPIFKTRRDAEKFHKHRGYGPCEWRVKDTFPMDVNMDRLSLVRAPPKSIHPPLFPDTTSLDLEDKDLILSLSAHGYGFFIIDEQSVLNIQGVVVVPITDLSPIERSDLLRATYERSFNIKE